LKNNIKEKNVLTLFLTALFLFADTVSSSSGVYSGAGSEGSNSPDSHHVARLLVTQSAAAADLSNNRRQAREPPTNSKTAGHDVITASARSDLLLVKATPTEPAGIVESNGVGGGGGGGGGQFPKCGRKMVERANSRVANLSGLVRLPFARLPQQQQQLAAAPVTANGSISRQLREF
jgi:hypothetical protein